VDVIARFTHIIQQHFAPNTFSIEQSPCLGLCHQGVNVRILAGEFLHHAHTKTDDEICAWLKTHAMPRPQPAKD
jgi:NADH:ubiquinone oxidoreductase subunit E